MRPEPTIEEIQRIGMEALLERLGPRDYLRFLRAFRPESFGQGDYTAERQARGDQMSVDEIMAIKAGTRPAPPPTAPVEPVHNPS